MRRHLLMRSLYALPCHRNGSLTERAKSGVKVLEHYLEYVLSGDMKAAGESYKKFKRFFKSRYVGDQYFKAYFDWCKREGIRPE